MIPLRLRSCVALAALPLLCLTGTGSARAAVIKVVTPGEQNTASGENGCALTMATCNGGTWHHYPELLQIALGAGYSVENNGDGGAILGCGPMSAALINDGSFCSSPQYTTSIATPAPDIVIIGPFGEHDQRILVSSAANMTNYYKESVFQDAYEGLVQKYLKYTSKIYIMTPIDVPFSANALPAGDDLVKDIMLPAAKAVATAHNLTVIDSYTAISGTTTLATMYYGSDGQVTSAGQQKMAMIIEAALAGGGTGAGGAGGAGGAAGAGAAGAGAAGAGAAGAGAAGSAGAAGAGGGTAAAGANGAAGVVGTAGTTGGSAGSSGTTGAAGQAGGTAGEPGAAGANGAAGAPVQGRETSGGGCSIAAAGARSWGGGLALAMVALVGLARRRRSRR
jgi:hypothetical protein